MRGISEPVHWIGGKPFTCEDRAEYMEGIECSVCACFEYCDACVECGRDDSCVCSRRTV